jgi:DNA repair protein RadA/Sms
MRSGSPARNPRPAFRCSGCGHETAKWHGRCPECRAWGSLDEGPPPGSSLRRLTPGPVTHPARRIREVSGDVVRPTASGVAEFDRVLGGGLTPGAVILLAGEPGVGKSTLLLATARAWAERGHGPVLVVSGEESAAQVRLRAERMMALHDGIFLAAEGDLDAVLGQVDHIQPRLLIVDSVQTIATTSVDGTAGGVSQVRAVAAALTAVAKERNMACVLVGHVTKDGAIAGPRVLEHLVDVVLHFEGDRHSILRTVRGVKNRYGPADEVGCFRMVPGGIEEMPDPSGLFLTRRSAAVPGTCTTVALQGRRALPVELQTLITPSGGETGRRTVSGIDSTRAAMVMAILQRWAGIGLAGKEVLAATVGGWRMTEPAADLALALAIWSSARDVPLRTGLVAVGELGLAADIHPVQGMPQRLAAAARVGFDHAIVPPGAAADRPRGMRVIEAATLTEALGLAGGEGVVRWMHRGGSGTGSTGSSGTDGELTG